jgi:hypothetical protein
MAIGGWHRSRATSRTVASRSPDTVRQNVVPTHSPSIKERLHLLSEKLEGLKRLH